MKVLNSESVWSPIGATEFATVIPMGKKPPATVADLAELQVMMVHRLVQEEKEKGNGLGWADQELRDLEEVQIRSIPENELTWENPSLPTMLLETEQFGATPVARWKSSASVAMRGPTKAGRDPDLIRELEAMTLAEWMQRVLM